MFSISWLHHMFSTARWPLVHLWDVLVDVGVQPVVDHDVPRPVVVGKRRGIPPILQHKMVSFQLHKDVILSFVSYKVSVLGIRKLRNEENIIVEICVSFNFSKLQEFDKKVQTFTNYWLKALKLILPDLQVTEYIWVIICKP